MSTPDAADDLGEVLRIARESRTPQPTTDPSAKVHIAVDVTLPAAGMDAEALGRALAQRLLRGGQIRQALRAASR